MVNSLSGVFLSGSDNFETANNSLLSLYKPTVVIYETGTSVVFDLTRILLPLKYVGLEE